MIQAIERTQEVSLLGLGIQGLTEENKSGEVFGQSIPGTGERVFLQYNFKAKLGIDGAEGEITKTSQSRYLISVPKFTFIGYDQPTFKVATEDGGILSWATPDIDKVEMVNEILNDDARQKYIASNEGLLKEQTKVFYNSLITSIDLDLATLVSSSVPRAFVDTRTRPPTFTNGVGWAGPCWPLGRHSGSYAASGRMVTASFRCSGRSTSSNEVRDLRRSGPR